MTDAVLTAVVERGDLAHLALLLWAGSASALAGLLLKELSASNRRFSQFVDEIERLNQIFNDHDGG
ncbi:hypothetical protein [Pannonibacter tanglangensis]|uniref:Uncharacterized protein n=1 Tax=Pannonibacter tanglangensis TaxID=2750084 RepID=A0ABW9ZDI1_9HYPH|nr:hypothetical protein [Pannonibacter sp. XCT-34]NBN62900.1 hypothetical protein [Pannonibacter sp. XCT-34]